MNLFVTSKLTYVFSKFEIKVITRSYCNVFRLSLTRSVSHGYKPKYRFSQIYFKGKNVFILEAFTSFIIVLLIATK